MKHSRKIRQPKKAKKVTLARIREMMREETDELFNKIAEITNLRLKPELESLYRSGEEKTMYFPPSPLKPVPPPPRVSAKRIADIPPIALPDEHEIEEEKI